MKLSTVRDAFIGVGAIALTVECVAVAADVTHRWWQADADDDTCGTLWRIGLDPTRRDLNPDRAFSGTFAGDATWQQRDASEAAALVDHGPGIFAETDDGAIFLPGSPEWDKAVSDPPSGAIFYRVG